MNTVVSGKYMIIEESGREVVLTFDDAFCHEYLVQGRKVVSAGEFEYTKAELNCMHTHNDKNFLNVPHRRQDGKMIMLHFLSNKT